MGPPWNDFLIFVATQLHRTPAFFDRMSSMMQPTMQEMLERMAKHDPEFRDNVRQSTRQRKDRGRDQTRASPGGKRWLPNQGREGFCCLNVSCSHLRHL